MADLNKNGIDDDLEAKAYKAQAVNAKFKQQLSYGIGAAMVFGLFTGMAGKLVTLAATAGAGALPILGLVALGVAGVGLLYLSAKYLSENTVRDQELQARQIAASQGKAPGVEQVVQPVVEKPNQFPASQGLAEKSEGVDQPKTTIGERMNSEPLIARVAANENSLPDKAANWQDKMTANNASAEQARA